MRPDEARFRSFGTAGDPGDLLLVPAGKRKAPPAGIPLEVSYDPATSTVTLRAQAKVRRGQALHLTVGPDGIAKITGLPPAGDGRRAGTDYLATITGRGIRQTNAARGGARSKATNLALGRPVPAGPPAGFRGPAT